MKSIILLAVIALMVGLLMWQYKTEYVSLEKNELHVKDASVARQLAVQDQCKDQAQARFRQLGWEGHGAATFKSHFNAKLDKCFVQIESSKASFDMVWSTVTLSDANSGSNIGSYSWRGATGQKPAEVPPFTCVVTMLSGEHRTCTSDAEFRGLIAAYMK